HPTDLFSTLLEERWKCRMAISHFERLCRTCRTWWQDRFEPTQSVSIVILPFVDESTIDSSPDSTHHEYATILLSHVNFQSLKTKDVLCDFKRPVPPPSPLFDPFGFNRKLYFLSLRSKSDHIKAFVA